MFGRQKKRARVTPFEAGIHLFSARRANGTMSEDNKQFMRRFVVEIINKKNLAAIDGLVSEDFVEHVPFPGQGPGREGQNSEKFDSSNP